LRVAFIAAAILLGIWGAYRTATHRLFASAESGEQYQRATQAPQAFYNPCRRGRWRIVERKLLPGSSYSISHILIRHRESSRELVPFSFLDWRAQLPAVTRTRSEAIKEATELAARLRRGDDFGSVARTVSEDPFTHSGGGRLGVFAASELLVWPQVLDCLGEGGVGSVSQPVETEFGIHLFRIESPPDLLEFAARRIVVGYGDAPFLQYSARDGRWESAQHRSRETAREIANSLSKSATRETFSEFVAQHSDHRDAAQDGDVGQWASRKATIFPRVLSRLLTLPVGAVSEAFDSEIGFQIFLRELPRDRTRYAMEAMRFAFEPNASTGKGTRNIALAMATDRLASWRQGRPDPLFLTPIEVWSEGRGPWGVEPLLKKGSIGDFLEAPLVSDSAYVVARRVGPPAVEEERTCTGICPGRASAARAAADGNLRALLQALDSTASAIPSQQRLAFERALTTLRANLRTATNPAAREEVWSRFAAGIVSTFGANLGQNILNLCATEVELFTLGFPAEAKP